MSPLSLGKELIKQSRGSNTPIAKHEPQLYGDLPDVTQEATSTFEVINECIYSSKWIGDTGQDSDTMSCECKDHFVGGENQACDENSDCINRLTLMECINEDCGCASECRNQRFQKCDYANVSVFKTEKKGYGLRADTDINQGRFIYEYVGEVIDEPRFHTRNAKYPTMGVKHFYFMSLEKDQFIDATMKGSIARFVNHSCNPNCETEKWVVGNKFRMGIFAKRDIKAGEELAFDYNVDRYGAEKQPCYCGEPNCLGYIGGKTQTNSAPKLSENLIEALGIDDEDMPAKKSRRPRKIDEDDEEYLAKAGRKPLDVDSVASVMSQLTSTKEKWIVSKLISRIQKCNDEAVLTRVLRFRGYMVIGKFLTIYMDDDNIISMILDTFINFPKITKNKITAAGVEPTIETLASSSNEEISSKAKELLEAWKTLETTYRIPRRMAGDQAEQINAIFLDRGRDSRSTSRTESPKRSPKSSTEPIPPWLANKNKPNFNNKPSPNFTKQPPRGPRADRERFGNHQSGDLPWGWHKCYQFNECYYYANDGRVSWDVPTQPCNGHGPPKIIPPPPPKPGQLREIQLLIQEAAAAAEAERKKKEDELKEKERQERRAKRKEKDAGKIYDAEKTRKYLSIAFGKHVPNMVNKFNRDLGSTPKSAKENVKKYSKEIVELLVDKEIRYHKQVVDPLNVCDDAKVAKVKLFVSEYVQKLIARRKAARQAEGKSSSPGGKRKHSSEAQEDALTKRLKSPTPPPSLSSGDAILTAVVPASSSPTKKRSHEEEGVESGRESPKRHRSCESLPNGISE
ncbi:hypothetical protein K440DRAFT_556444 [Wilcoxina mikolae CBS 423.85]|nr:hypothetical protein K440DRAFT_556444 [Wilcoxina mikolae CBS 423.85]